MTMVAKDERGGEGDGGVEEEEQRVIKRGRGVEGDGASTGGQRKG